MVAFWPCPKRGLCYYARRGNNNGNVLSAMAALPVVQFWIPVSIAVFLLLAMLRLSLKDISERKRLDAESSLPIRDRFPKHYKTLQSVEGQLWNAEEHRRSETWESSIVYLRNAEAKIVNEYLVGLRDDFRRANNIFSAVVRHSPDFRRLRELESQRVRVILSFYLSLTILLLRLKIGRCTSIRELRQITDIVATLALEVRTVLHALESAGHGQFVESVLKSL